MFVSKKKFEEFQSEVKELASLLCNYKIEVERWKADRTTKIEVIARLLKYEPIYRTVLFRDYVDKYSINLGSHTRTCSATPSKTEDYQLTETPIIETKKGKKK